MRNLTKDGIELTVEGETGSAEQIAQRLGMVYHRSREKRLGSAGSAGMQREVSSASASGGAYTQDDRDDHCEYKCCYEQQDRVRSMVALGCLDD